MPKISPVPNRNGFREVFLTGFKAAVPGSASRGHGSSNCRPLLTQYRRAEARRAGQAGLPGQALPPGQGLSLGNPALPRGAAARLSWAPLARRHGSACEWGPRVPGAAVREGSTRPGMLADETGRDYTYPTNPKVRPLRTKPFLPLCAARAGNGVPAALGMPLNTFLSHCQHLLRGYFLRPSGQPHITVLLR